jgi:hypothetical protein
MNRHRGTARSRPPRGVVGTSVRARGEGLMTSRLESLDELMVASFLDAWPGGVLARQVLSPSGERGDSQ